MKIVLLLKPAWPAVCAIFKALSLLMGVLGVIHVGVITAHRTQSSLAPHAVHI